MTQRYSKCSRLDDNYPGANGNVCVLSGPSPSGQHGRSQVRVTFDQMLLRTGPSPMHRLR